MLYEVNFYLFILFNFNEIMLIVFVYLKMILYFVNNCMVLHLCYILNLIHFYICFFFIKVMIKLSIIFVLNLHHFYCFNYFNCKTLI